MFRDDDHLVRRVHHKRDQDLREMSPLDVSTYRQYAIDIIIHFHVETIKYLRRPDGTKVVTKTGSTTVFGSRMHVCMCFCASCELTCYL